MRGQRTLTGNFGDSAALLANPPIAVVLGLALGVGLMMLSRLASTFVTPADPFRGFALVMLVMGAKFLVVAAVLVVYFNTARGGFAAFGTALAVAFLGSLVAEGVRASRTLSSSTSA
ncbi:MAG: hypothetical protein ACYC77_10430 [Coriobacteriia bacterium]